MLCSEVLLLRPGHVTEVRVAAENCDKHAYRGRQETPVDAHLPLLLFLDNLVRLALPLSELTVKGLHIIFIL